MRWAWVILPPSVAEGDSFPRWGTPSHQLKLSPLGESDTASAVTKGVAGFECVRDFLPLFSLVDPRENASYRRHAPIVRGFN